ncbi:MAG: MoaD/ThiS family protein [Phycisphaerales bacterium]|nr:MoaD/ThiS family protein [Phycisphaerales bacterium]
MATITVKFFGPARELVDEAEIALEIDEGETVGVAAGILSEKYPKLGIVLGIRLAVNRAYVALDHKLSDGDEIAVIPPVSGG